MKKVIDSVEHDVRRAISAGIVQGMSEATIIRRVVKLVVAARTEGVKSAIALVEDAVAAGLPPPLPGGELFAEGYRTAVEQILELLREEARQ